MKSLVPLLVTGALLAGVSLDAHATNFAGKFDIADNFGTNTSTRFYNATVGLSVFAPAGIPGDLLREAFFRKTYVNVSYTPIACPAGITGSCGTVTTVSVSASNIP